MEVDEGSMVEVPRTVHCSHCGYDIVVHNYELHSIHCTRSRRRCADCGEMVAISQADDHHQLNHVIVPCGECGEEMEIRKMGEHRSDLCLKRPQICEFCDLEFPFVNLHEHQYVCGSRTDLCPECRTYIQLRHRVEHEEWHFDMNLLQAKAESLGDAGASSCGDNATNAGGIGGSDVGASTRTQNTTEYLSRLRDKDEAVRRMMGGSAAHRAIPHRPDASSPAGSPDVHALWGNGANGHRSGRRRSGKRGPGAGGGKWWLLAAAAAGCILFAWVMKGSQAAPSSSPSRQA